MTTKTLIVDNKKYLISGNQKDKSVIRDLEKLNGKYEPHILNILASLIKPNYVMFDVGANIGVISIVMSHYAPQGKVYAFEPIEENYSYLSLNIKQNKIKNIFPYKIAAYNENTDLVFSYVDEFAGGAFHSDTGEDDPRALHEVVEAQKLDDFVLEQNIKSINLVKIDVEGAEIKVIQGFKNSLLRYNPILIIESNRYTLNKFYNTTPLDLYRLLKGIYSYIYIITRPYGQLNEVNTEDKFMSFFPSITSVQDLLCINNKF